MLLAVAPLLKTSRSNSSNLENTGLLSTHINSARVIQDNSHTQIRPHLSSDQAARSGLPYNVFNQLRPRHCSSLGPRTQFSLRTYRSQPQQITLPDRSLLQISSRETISFRYPAVCTLRPAQGIQIMMLYSAYKPKSAYARLNRSRSQTQVHSRSKLILTYSFHPNLMTTNGFGLYCASPSAYAQADVNHNTVPFL
ncbi:disease resistance protein [Dorcoceras hygrometricum]|uniref:Disease resistance protein n=1 Tax=Dorcoceras hygrometricum TaxID=472368 RepID=A0A2Z7B714_9LAMI|nr:disease resistance protein [Dorcoceras hygrometricum]